MCMMQKQARSRNLWLIRTIWIAAIKSIFPVLNRLGHIAIFFGRGELLHEIPMESERRELNGLSLSSLGAAAVCKVAGQDFGGNPNAYDELKKELARIQKELMQNR